MPSFRTSLTVIAVTVLLLGGFYLFACLSGCSSRGEAPPDLIYRVSHVPLDGKVRVWYSHWVDLGSASFGGPLSFRDAEHPNLLVWVSGNYTIEEVKQR